jgi:hypothetical protein
MIDLKQYIASHGSRPPNTPNYVILHTNGASKTGYDLSSYINGQLALGNTSVTQPHRQVPLDGVAFRYLDDNEKGVASFQIEGKCISIETSDYGYLHSDINTQPWTPEQIQTLAELCAQAHKVWGVPLRLPTHPLTDGGIGAHTMWPDNQYGDIGEGLYGHHYLKVNGVSRRVLTNNPWTTNVGKICPGKARKAQVPEIINLAKSIVGQIPPPTPVEENMIYLIQDSSGVFVTSDFVSYRAVAPVDIEFFLYHGLVEKNLDGSARVIGITDHRNRMADMSPEAVNARTAFIINEIVKRLPTGGGTIPIEAINAIVTGVVTNMPRTGIFTLK